jgi:ribosomal protein L29
METQLRKVSKEELHKMIDEIPEDELMVLTYKKDEGISDNGKRIKKKKTKVFVDRATIIVLTENKPIRRVDLEGNFYKIPIMSKGNIIKTILLPQRE